jgi:hypothetical protein
MWLVALIVILGIAIAGLLALKYLQRRDGH